ncbi:MAG TPA: MFS transporter [Thermoplasmata archaeon]|nr:MFS transporter [Thermoplasmata archaeon]
MSVPPATSDPSPPASRHAARVLIVLASAALLVSFIETMLTPALPRLASFFGNAPYTTVAWILSAYLLVGVATIPLFAKLGDLYGKRRVLAIVLSIYTVAVALAPATPVLASSFGLSRGAAIYLLIGVRGVQGVGLAMFPLALAMVAEALPRERVAPAQGIVAAMFAVGSALGLVGGSWLIEAFGWQVAYASVLPFVVVLPILSRTWLPEGHAGTGGRIDLVGAGLLAGGLASFLLALTLGPSWGWARWVGGLASGVPLGVPELFALAALFLVGFLLWTSRASEPLLDLGRFRERNVALGYLGAMLVGLAMYVAFVVLTVLVEFPIVGLGQSVLDFGLLSIPTTVAMFIAAPLVGRGVARFGPRPMVVVGSLLSGTGFLLLLGFHATYLELVTEAVPTFTGLVAVLVAVTNVIAMASRHGERGIQMGLTEMFQDLGASVGPVVVAALLATFTRIALVPDPALPSGVASVVVPSAASFDWIFGVGLAISVLTGVLGALLTNYRLAADARADARAAEPAPSPAPSGGP